ncbi:Flp pilus assembly complex ATPase component TadA, partial [Candidatus Woesearchaeota archaeon]|nr:Flp pilus assembly complex ATPase component TadA [Candidatus Woesearchaeota archaeon]
GGTASGKTSMLNVITNFFPPNQRIISIEDTREVRLPKFLHWVPLSTRQPNTEGKGGISMLDLLVNSLRMRPDRIIVGEIRRKKEAQILFEAIHTGHSVFATVHANNTKETITRLTSPPIEIPKSMIPAISLMIIQYRNRRTGLRRTFQVAEIQEDGTPNLLMQYNANRDVLMPVNPSKSVMNTLELYTGQKRKEIEKEIHEKEKILKWLVKHNIVDVDAVGRVMAEFYTKKDNLMRYVHADRPLG